MKPGKLSLSTSIFFLHIQNNEHESPWKTLGWRGFALACNEGQQFLSKLASRVERRCIAHRGRNTSWLYFIYLLEWRYQAINYFFLCLFGRFGDQDVLWNISFKIRAKIDINICEYVSLRKRVCFCQLCVRRAKLPSFARACQTRIFSLKVK